MYFDQRTDGNLAALHAYEKANDSADTNMECVKERCEGLRLEAEDAVSAYQEAMKSESEEFGLSDGWWDTAEDVGL